MNNKTLIDRKDFCVVSHEASVPIISIITASYNCVETIERTILSVLGQKTKNIEYIIIDGGSNDGAVEVIKRYSESLAYWVSEKDNGIYDAWNKGISKSTGKYIAFLGADDVLKDNYAPLYLNCISQCKDVDYISSKMSFTGESDREYGIPFCWDKFRVRMDVVHPGSVHNRILFETYGLYDTNFRIVGDYEFLLRMGKTIEADFIDAVTVEFGLNGVSSTRVFRSALEVFRAKIKTKARSIGFIYLEFLQRLCLGLLSRSFRYIRK